MPSKEVQIYTWMDATLKELTALGKEVNQECRKPGSRFDFALVFPDSRANTYRMREIGSTVSGRKDPADMKTLGQARFQIGDYLDVAINIPGDDRGGGGGNDRGMDCGPPPRSMDGGRGGPRGGGRDHLFNGGRNNFGCRGGADRDRDHHRGRPY